MVILLPNKRNGIKQLTRDIIHIPIGSIFSELREKEVYLQLPRFSAEYKNDLSESLKSLQITDIFSQKANLTRILTDKNETLFVSKILHAAKIIVNEEGSEAAAATGILINYYLSILTKWLKYQFPHLHKTNPLINIVCFSGRNSKQTINLAGFGFFSFIFKLTSKCFSISRCNIRSVNGQPTSRIYSRSSILILHT